MDETRHYSSEFSTNEWDARASRITPGALIEDSLEQSKPNAFQFHGIPSSRFNAGEMTAPGRVAAALSDVQTSYLLLSLDMAYGMILATLNQYFSPRPRDNRSWSRLSRTNKLSWS